MVSNYSDKYGPAHEYAKSAGVKRTKDAFIAGAVGAGAEMAKGVISMTKDNKFFGHSKVNKQNIVKNPPKQVPQLGKDGFYSNVKNRTGQL